ncbi:MAG TPA: sulfatase-like hydrolase/transferase, partial [Thermoanaerobaculia bacterium]|nr:sulfatase-like hydrolase/transferase [Thermoanaerobaculia bacterium]
AVLFSRAWANYPLTLPSHVSMLTGLLPTEHGVRDNIGYRFDAAAHPYLPRLLAERGFTTGAAVSTWLLRADSGLGEGFDFYEDAVDRSPGMSLGESQRPGSVTVERALEWLRQHQGGKFFLFLHLYEPHTPYDPPEPYRSAAAHPYDGEIALADALVGRVLDALREQGDYQRATVILLSDHGEGLGDHGESEHGILLYREALQVPLLVKLPGNRRAGATVAAAAQLADVAPTVAALAGAPEKGRTTLLDLMGEAPPQRRIYAETYAPRIHFGWSEQHSLIDGDLHYMEGPDPELYDLATDPGERRNVLRERRRDYAALREALRPLRRELAAPAEVDAETRQRLAALGYVAATVATSGSEPLPDPRTQLHLLDDLADASARAREGRHEEAVAILQRVLAEEPRVTEGWEQLGVSLAELGRDDEAEAAWVRALEASGGRAGVALRLAHHHLARGLHDQARRHAELALAADPAAAHQLLAEVALRSGDAAVAEEHARAALSLDPGDPAAMRQLSRAAAAAGDPGGSQELARELMRRHPDDSRGYLQLALLLRDRGEAAAAVRVLEGAVARGVDDPAVRRQLGLTLAEVGRSGEAITVLAPLAEDPADLESASALAVALTDMGRHQEAVVTLERVLAADPRHARALETLGIVHLRLQRPAEAQRHLERALAIDPALPAAWNTLGVVRAMQGNAAAAMRAWERAVELDPQLLDALYNLGLTAARVGDTQRARAALSRYVAIAPAASHGEDIAKARRLLEGLG